MEKEDYVSLETAKMLKEKGFNEPVLSQYSKTGTIWTCNEPENFNNSKDCYSRPTLYEAQKWLLSKGIFVHPVIYMNDKFGFMVKGVGVFSKINSEFIMPYYSTFQQALDAGIRKALKLILRYGRYRKNIIRNRGRACKKQIL